MRFGSSGNELRNEQVIQAIADSVMYDLRKPAAQVLILPYYVEAVTFSPFWPLTVPQIGNVYAGVPTFQPRPGGFFLISKRAAMRLTEAEFRFGFAFAAFRHEKSLKANTICFFALMLVGGAIYPVMEFASAPTRMIFASALATLWLLMAILGIVMLVIPCDRSAMVPAMRYSGREAAVTFFTKCAHDGLMPPRVWYAKILLRYCLLTPDSGASWPPLVR